MSRQSKTNPPTPTLRDLAYTEHNPRRRPPSPKILPKRRNPNLFAGFRLFFIYFFIFLFLPRALMPLHQVKQKINQRETQVETPPGNPQPEPAGSAVLRGRAASRGRGRGFAAAPVPSLPQTPPLSPRREVRSPPRPVPVPRGLPWIPLLFLPRPPVCVGTSVSGRNAPYLTLSPPGEVRGVELTGVN